MDVHYSDELKQAFIVSPDHLKKLVELLQKRIGKVDISRENHALIISKGSDGV